MTHSLPTVHAHHANKSEIRQVAQLMLAGISSDPGSMQGLASSWWKRLFFERAAAPRFLRQQMDTLVVSQSGQVTGYLALQYSGAGAGVFDWGVAPAMDGEGMAVFKALLKQALKMVAERENYDFFYIGLLADLPHVPAILQEQDFSLLDYQLVQVEASLPMHFELARKEKLILTPKIAQRYRPQLLELLQVDYPDDPELAQAAAAVHATLIGNSKLYEISLDSEVAGVVQQTTYQNESRSLYALKPALWNSDAERQLVAALVAQLSGRAKRVRLRTFSRAHLEASRPLLESMGLDWKESVWHRWVKRVED